MKVKAPFSFEHSSNGAKLYCYQSLAQFETIGFDGKTKRYVIRIDAPVHEHGNGFACDGKCGARS